MTVRGDHHHVAVRDAIEEALEFLHLGLDARSDGRRGRHVTERSLDGR
jgi:hypothetical protein